VYVELKLFVDVPNLFLLIAGGDGTICSVMNYVKTIPKWKDHNPPAAILPLGTGNDLSRALGWGGSIE
jgi:diacylglycerol kinase (ATP)